MGAWWEDAVVYEVYPRSFQDSSGDGIGDLRGAIARLDHLEWLGVDALWLAPVYRSPMADLGYDVADHTAVDPDYGSLADLDALIEAAHGRGIRVLLDLVASHTSIEHPWFREHPERYVWSDDGPANNWVAAFGGPAWTRDPRSGRWYLHSFFPEQPDLDWRNPDVGRAIAGVIRFWLDRGVDGFRIDAVDRLAKDPELRDDPPASADAPLPVHPQAARLDQVHSRGGPGVGSALGPIRGAAGDALLVGEVYLPTDCLGPYLEYLDLAFAFDLLHAEWSAPKLRRTLERASAMRGLAWVISNHDYHRVPDRFGPAATRAAAMLLLTLPGPAFVYQGEEIGMGDGPGADPPLDRFGRDRYRHPMQWEPAPGGGFTEATPWLGLVDPVARNVADQHADPDSLLCLYRDLIALRRRLRGPLEPLESASGVLAFARGDHVIAINPTPDEQPLPAGGELALATAPGAARGDRLAGHGGAVLRRG